MNRKLNRITLKRVVISLLSFSLLAQTYALVVIRSQLPTLVFAMLLILALIAAVLLIKGGYQVEQAARELDPLKAITTANKLKGVLLKMGVSTEDICDQHLFNIYQAMPVLPVAAKQLSASEILQATEDVGKTDPSVITAVIVETRKHAMLERIVNSVVNRLGIPVQIFHGSDNLDFIMSTSISKLVDMHAVYLTPLKTNVLNARMYNALFLSDLFWQQLIGRTKILVFQTDALLCDDSDYEIDDFTGFDYIGSNWSRKRPSGFIIDGGSGGLSLRDWHKSYECLQRFKPEYWGGGEDGYFAFHIELIGGKIASPDASAKFSTQNEFLYKSWGGHQISLLTEPQRQAFVAYCSAADAIL